MADRDTYIKAIDDYYEAIENESGLGVIHKMILKDIADRLKDKGRLKMLDESNIDVAEIEGKVLDEFQEAIFSEIDNIEKNGVIRKSLSAHLKYRFGLVSYELMKKRWK